MKLTVIGCAGSYPNASSPASCYLLEHDGARILLDLGNGALGVLQQHIELTWPGALDAVVLSHCHVDHFVDVASLYVQRHYAAAPPSTRLPLLGPSDTANRVAAVYGMDVSQVHAEFDVQSVADATRIGPFEIAAIRAAHPVEAYSLRVTAGGQSITYSGDTGPTVELAELARGTDVALFEASFAGDDNPPDLHLSGRDAGRIAAQAGAGMLVLTHLVAWNDEATVIDEATAEFPGPIEIARSGMAITL